MEDEDRWLILAVALLVAIVVMVAIISNGYTRRITTMMEKGYQEDVVRGSQATLYRKVNPKGEQE